MSLKSYRGPYCGGRIENASRVEYDVSGPELAVTENYTSVVINRLEGVQDFARVLIDRIELLSNRLLGDDTLQQTLNKTHQSQGLSDTITESPIGEEPRGQLGEISYRINDVDVQLQKLSRLIGRLEGI